MFSIRTVLVKKLAFNRSAEIRVRARAASKQVSICYSRSKSQNLQSILFFCHFLSPLLGCHVLNHVPICTCNEGLMGDPFVQCTPKPAITDRPMPKDLCNPSPCGPNADCLNGECRCIAEYQGNPYEGCRPECTTNAECSRDRACLRSKCVDPCPGTCGQSAVCEVINHIPICSCPTGYTGDPFVNCRIAEIDSERKRDVCTPSPCGPNSQCRNINEHAVCSCIQGFIGTPPQCRPECVVSSECAPTQACVNQKCVDPCRGACGRNARCEVFNHSPICSCKPGETGDPFRSCQLIPVEAIAKDEGPRDPCVPSPCGPNSQCRANADTPSCQCILGYVGSPPNCRPECVINADCPSQHACINNKCVDPCPGSCGTNAECHVISHTVSCICPPSYIGNPFVQCIIRQTEPINPCEPSPCGSNAECTQRNGVGSCRCIEDYRGNPYEGCRPECVLSSDCVADRACIGNKCKDPCPGICGLNAECSTVNHVPTCICISGYTGDPFTSCQPQRDEPITVPAVFDVCRPSPCGPNSKCHEVNGVSVCTCEMDYIGVPPNCKPECTVNAECPQNKACHKFKCTNPCTGTCGISAGKFKLKAKIRKIILTSNSIDITVSFTRLPGDQSQSNLSLYKRYDRRSIRSMLPSPCARRNADSTCKSMCSVTVRPICRMSSERQQSVVFVFAQLLRFTAKLSTGMCRELRLCIRQSMHRRKMYKSMRRLLWLQFR